MSDLILPEAASGTQDRLTLTMGQWPFDLYLNSMARNEPETVALLAGHLDRPTHITDFFFMPPRHEGGRFDHGAAHVAIDAPAMNYLIDRVLKPSGKYMLGLWHSHPGGCVRPSGPDLRLCRTILNNDDSPGRTWRFFLAPITTFDADGRDRITAWVLRKGADAFAPALFVPPTPVTVPSPDASIASPPAPPALLPAADVTDEHPLVARCVRLGRRLVQSDGLVGVPRHRAEFHLEMALRSAESGADLEVGS